MTEDRIRLAQVLLDFMTGDASTDDIEDLSLATPECFDIQGWLWFQYSDDVSWQELNPVSHENLTRVAAFLLSDAVYRWPRRDFFKPLWVILTLGLIGRKRRRQAWADFCAAGEISVYPFISVEQMNQYAQLMEDIRQAPKKVLEELLASG